MHHSAPAKHQRRLGAGWITGLSRSHRFHAVTLLAEPYALCTNRRSVGEGCTDGRAIVDDAIALRARQVDLDASVLWQGAEVAAVARPGDKSRVCCKQRCGGEGVRDVTASSLAQSIPPAGLDQIGSAAQILAGDLGEENIGHMSSELMRGGVRRIR